MKIENKIKKIMNISKYKRGYAKKKIENKSYEYDIITGIFFQISAGYNGVDMSGRWDFIPFRDIEKIKTKKDFLEISQKWEYKLEDWEYKLK